MKEKNIVKKIVREIKRPFGQMSSHFGFTSSNKVCYAFSADGMRTSYNCDFLTDPRFIQAHEAGKATTPELANYDFRWRQRIVLWAAEHASKLEGDFVECGVFKGYLARMIFEYIPFTTLDKVFWLLDTYEGMVPNLMSSQEKKYLELHSEWYAGYKTTSYETVCNTFCSFGRHVRVIKGIVPDTLSEVTAEKIAYLSIDMNCAVPEIATAEYFWPKLVPGAVIVLDDYGFAGYEEQKDAFNQFAERKNTTILPLPTGQGIIIKN